VRVAEFGGHEEFEVWAERKKFFSKLDAIRALVLHNVLLEKGFKHWVENFFDIFKQHGFSIFYRHGDVLSHLGVRHLERRQIVGFLHVFDPLIRLGLWVNHKRPSLSLSS